MGDWKAGWTVGLDAVGLVKNIMRVKRRVKRRVKGKVRKKYLKKRPEK